MTVGRLANGNNPVVYYSLQQVVSRLTAPDVAKSIPGVTNLLKIAQWNHLLDKNNRVLPLKPRYPPASNSQGKMPFIVVEGLDGSGKTRVSTGLSEKLNLQLMRTPPNFIKSFKELFDEHNESIRRAYYSLGNYLAANEVQYYCFSQGVVMDRYWHSTAAYALAHEMTTSGSSAINESDFVWPKDLLQPDLVIFLVVSEETRRFRHAYRNTTNTKEEQTLATSETFRKNLIECYNRINGPPLVQIDANNVSDDISVDENIAAIIKKVYEVVIDKLNISKIHDDATTGKLSI